MVPFLMMWRFWRVKCWWIINSPNQGSQASCRVQIQRPTDYRSAALVYYFRLFAGICLENCDQNRKKSQKYRNCLRNNFNWTFKVQWLIKPNIRFCHHNAYWLLPTGTLASTTSPVWNEWGRIFLGLTLRETIGIYVHHLTLNVSHRNTSGVLAPTQAASSQCVLGRCRSTRLNLVRPPLAISTGNLVAFKCSVADELVLANRAPADNDSHQQPRLWTFWLALKLAIGRNFRRSVTVT